MCKYRNDIITQLIVSLSKMKNGNKMKITMELCHRCSRYFPTNFSNLGISSGILKGFSKTSSCPINQLFSHYGGGRSKYIPFQPQTSSESAPASRSPSQR